MSQYQNLGEFELIERYFARAVKADRSDVILGIGDDAALLRLPESTELVVAVDTVVAGRHFPFDSDPRSIGHRSLAVNLSDLAAMGATPTWATLALTLPAADPTWLQAFSEGFMRLADAHSVVLVGGDTTAGPLTVSVQILGHVACGTALKRSGAQPGDVLAVTGTLGDAGAGLALAMSKMAAGDPKAAVELIDRFEYPRARVAFGALARGVANAAMDLSDGLAGDVPKLVAASGLAATVDIERLPLSAALQATVTESRARRLALSAGDDYELLLSVPARRFDELAAAAQSVDLKLTAIGELRRGSGVDWCLDGCLVEAPAPGYDHFR